MQSNANSSSTSPQVQGVNSTSGGLLKATLGAAIAAGAILTFVWLPAEHGIDPTGVGHVLGLTEMGHIKEQLHADADADATAQAQAQAQQATQATAQGVQFDTTELNQKLDAIQAQLNAIAATLETTTQAANAQAAAKTTAVSEIDNSAEPIDAWLNEVEYALIPGEGVEVKLTMDKGAVAEFEWTANGAVVNHDTHGDGDGQSISYEKGRSVPEQAGKLTAAFTGNHGWFWRNRTDKDVVVTLRTRGDYKGMVLP